MSFTYESIPIQIYNSNTAIKLHVPTNLGYLLPYNFDLLTEGHYLQVLDSFGDYDHKLIKLGSTASVEYKYNTSYSFPSKIYSFSSSTSNIGSYPSNLHVSTATIRVNQFVFSTESLSTIIDPYLFNFMGDNCNSYHSQL